MEESFHFGQVSCLYNSIITKVCGLSKVVSVWLKLAISDIRTTLFLAIFIVEMLTYVNSIYATDVL